LIFIIQSENIVKGVEEFLEGKDDRSIERHSLKRFRIGASKRYELPFSTDQGG